MPMVLATSVASSIRARKSKQLNTNFNSLCNTVFILEKRKQSQFYLEINSNEKIKETLTLDYGNDEIKQHNKVIYLGCNPDDNLSREPMATKMLGPVNGRLKKKF